MVAYSFQKRFVDAIEADEKRQTIRGLRKRHARYGEELQLYQGMRTRHCRLIGRRRCLSVDPIAISVEDERIVVGHISAAVGADHERTFPISFDEGPQFEAKEIIDRDRFAEADGFAGWRSMKLFWTQTHADPEQPAGWFVGVLIRWAPVSAVPEAPEAPSPIAAELDAIGVR
ncbi:hypothetical protein [Aurantimonas sp. 22II-16-19i]|uniref:hypothetical protein n=1 Tax=Aurantimonas sp. 22II-16-19i TaxID=1317114 RepID=UPI0009F80084|nr:hypothetical protein [Aurantimonas sp. 22II-16-19i]ORE93225.1 hypothetical protein ATO4_15780 [Aurantimonas sp. 22II-16-19i]